MVAASRIGASADPVPPAAPPTVDAGSTQAAVASAMPPTATLPAGAASPASGSLTRQTASVPKVVCQEACLIRLVEPSPSTLIALTERGLRPAYAHGGQLWAVAPSALTGQLRADGLSIAVVNRTGDTTALYVVRLPDGEGEALARQVGEVVDRVDNQLIIQAEHLPPDIADLASSGVWIEKLPAPRPLSSVAPDRVVLGDMSAVADSIASDRLAATILDLQEMGATDGTFGSRSYTDRGNALAADYIYRRLADEGLTVWYEDFAADDGTFATNVVGELPGRDPSKVYVVSAHYDSMADGPVAPGADDNATGVAGMLEIAHVLSGYELAYPVRFVALTAEEVGLQGANAFVARAEAEGTPFAGVFNLDAIGSPVRDHQLIVNADADSAWLEALLDGVNDRYGVGQDLRFRQNPEIVADDNVLRDAGIPAVLVTRAVFGESVVHHTVEDEVSAVDLHGVEEATRLVLIAVASVVATTVA